MQNKLCDTLLTSTQTEENNDFLNMCKRKLRVTWNTEFNWARDQQAYGQAGSRGERIDQAEQGTQEENDVIPSEIVRCLTWILSEREPRTY